MPISTAWAVASTLAAWMAPCSVKANGRALENFSFWRWSQFEVGRKPAAVSLDLLVEPLGWHAVDLGQIGVDHHAQGAHGLDPCLDARHRHGGHEATFGQLKSRPRRGLRARYIGLAPPLSRRDALLLLAVESNIHFAAPGIGGCRRS